MARQDSGVEVLKMHRLDGKANIKAFADIGFAGVFIVKGIKVIEGKNGLFVGMPQEKGKDGKWYDRVHPLTKEFRDILNGVILEAYQESN